MSMIFKKPSHVSSACPWCRTKNERSLNDTHIEWYGTLVFQTEYRLKLYHSQKCHGRYQTAEEVNEIAFQTALSPSSASQERQTENSGSEYDLVSPDSTTDTKNDESHDVHLYTRVQVIGVHFRVVLGTPDKTPEHLVLFKSEQLQHKEKFMRDLADSFGLSREDCLSILQDSYGKPSTRIPETTNISYILTM